MCVRTKLLFEKIDPEKDTVIVPLIVVSEILVPVPATQRLSVVSKLQEMFELYPFDLPAATIAADLVARHGTLSSTQQYNERQVLRADAMIIASAKAARAEKFYCHDKKCRALASLIMEACDLPTGDETMIDKWMAADIRDGKQPPKTPVSKLETKSKKHKKRERTD